MRVVVTGGAGFIGSNLVDALLARGDEVVVVDDLCTGKRENVAAGRAARRGATSAPPRSRMLFAEVPRSSSTSPRRPTCRPPCAGPTSTRRSTSSAPSACCRRRATPHVVFSSTGGAIYGECERPAREDDPRRPLSPYGVAKLAAEEYLAGVEPPARDARTRRSGSRTSTGRGRRPGSRAASSRSSWTRWPRARRRRSSATGGRPATSSTSTTSSRPPRRARARAASSTSAAARRRRSPSCTSACRAVTGDDRPPRLAPPREGDVRRSVLDVSLAGRELGWRPRSASTRGCAGPGTGSRRGRKERAPAGANQASVDTPSTSSSSSAPGAPPRWSPPRSPPSSSPCSSSPG